MTVGGFSEDDRHAVVRALERERTGSERNAEWQEQRALELEAQDDEESRELTRKYRAGAANAKARVAAISAEIEQWGGS